MALMNSGRPLSGIGARTASNLKFVLFNLSRLRFNANNGNGEFVHTFENFSNSLTEDVSCGCGYFMVYALFCGDHLKKNWMMS
ncbi:hypothetical protein CEXT_176611 [Caerostris extrusa]|uniref:Uncharacterized protein n=1 Tax=Caerostris extrusa TaxID=172846 RepID=A0AAV4Y7Q5_CAEEX|nr:hypothetical protein CEXT_176611 [Caerostris extrusa]